MKKFKKMMAMALAMVMVLAMGVTVFADTPDTVPTAGTGTITVNNAGIGEKYTAYKVLDAKVGANGAIVYPGPVPTGLEDCFQMSSDGVNLEKKGGLSDADLFAKLKTWAATATKTAGPIEATTSTVQFTSLPFGYYVIVSTMDNGAVISVDSTNPDAVTYEKNTTVPQPEKTVDDTAYTIGDTITYTVKFPGANYMIPMKGEEPNQVPDPENAQIVTKYEVSDTLPAFLSDVTVTSIKIGETEYKNDTLNVTNFPGVTSFGTTKKFDIPWATAGANAHEWTSKYPNGTEVVITYTAKLTDITQINDANINTVTVQPYVDKPDSDEPGPWDENWNDDAEVKTYAAALKKVDGSTSAKPLAGAKFAFKGLTVKETVAGEKGNYTVVSYDPTSTTLGTEMEVGADGMLYIIGLDDKTITTPATETTEAVTADVELVGNETVAPAGYNKLTSDVKLKAQVMSSEIFKLTGYRKYDAKGNIIEESTTTITDGQTVTKNLSDLDAAAVKVVNNAGTELPSTGGIGTTIFYVIGAILVLGAGILLVTRRRMNAN